MYDPTEVEQYFLQTFLYMFFMVNVFFLGLYIRVELLAVSDNANLFSNKSVQAMYVRSH